MLSIAMPMVVSHACYSIMTFTDRLFLSKLSPAEMNAAMGGGLTVFMMMTFFFGLIGYSTALTAQYFGAGQKSKCASVVTQSLIISVIAYPIIMVSKSLGIMLFDYMGISPEQLYYQKIYFNTLMYAVIITLFRITFTSFFSGIGKTAIVMKSFLVAMVVNIAFNYILIFGKFGFPALGIKGAAYGTIIGGLAGVAVLIAAYFKRDNRLEYKVMKSFYCSSAIMGKLFKFGYPSGLEMLLNIVAFNVLVMLFHSHSLATATAATIIFNWDMISFIPLLGIGIGVTSLVGRYMGAGKTEIAEKSVISGVKMSVLYSSVILICFLFFTESLVDIFKPSDGTELFLQARPIAIFMLKVAALYVTVDALVVVFIGALRGAGDTFVAMVLSVSMHWAAIPVLYFMLRVLNFSPEKCWAIVVLIFSAFSFLIYGRYKGGKWKTIKVIDDENREFIDELRAESDL